MLVTNVAARWLAFLLRNQMLRIHIFAWSTGILTEVYRSSSWKLQGIILNSDNAAF
jgi:hypothetical protein